MKAIALLSGGIDSPVAIHKLKDKLEIIAIHFHQMPLSSKEDIDKVKNLTKKLNIKKLYLVPFVNILKLLVEKCDHRNYFILQKIAMFKTAKIIAKKENAKFLITGENLAQVSSQTLSNLVSITKSIDFPILRPLLTYDKQEIINIAKEINTYEISKGPEICCLLGPKHPSTKSNPESIKDELESIDLNNKLQETLNNSEILQ